MLSPDIKIDYNNKTSYTTNNNTISIPISIPNQIEKTNSQSVKLNLTDQYSLVANIFDPSKMSPPDSWKGRLQKRLKDHQISYSNSAIYTNKFHISNDNNE